MTSEQGATGAQVPLWNIANVLTVVRLILVPVMVWLLLLDGPITRWAGVVVFMIATATDKFDGDIARAWGLITNFGKIVDPIADKALVLSALVVLNIYGLLALWVTILIAARELAVTLLRFFMLKTVVIPASQWGKWKTVSQLFMIWIMLIPWPTFLAGSALQWMPSVFLLLITVAVFMTVTSGVDYFVAAFAAGDRRRP